MLFRSRFPQDIVVQKKLRHYLLALEHQTEANEVLYRIGVIQFTGGFLGQAMRSFVSVLEDNPKHEAATLALYTCYLIEGKNVKEELRDFRALQRWVYKRFNVLRPTLAKWESMLNGGVEDQDIYRKCIALLEKNKKQDLASRYLVKLGAFQMKLNLDREAKRSFDRAIEKAKCAAWVYRDLMTVPGIRRFFNPMALSRKASGRAEGTDSDPSIASLRKKI